jgi:hypothetical protein
MIDEMTGRAILKTAFEAAGLNIQEEFPFASAGISLSIDGYDPVARVGYEYITTADGDREELNPMVVAELDRLNEEGVIHLFLIDERFIEGADCLREAAQDFLSEMLSE